MSQFKQSKQDLASLEVETFDQEERITSPSALRILHARFCEDDADSSANRTAVRELMDFMPPYDPLDLKERGQEERFNINFGLAASMRNEAIGPFLDIFTSPTSISKIALTDDVDEDMRATWASIMDDEWTKMIRSWDVMMSNVLQLVDIMVTDGIAIPWHEDEKSLKHNIGSLEDCKFDAEAEAVPSKIEVFTIRRRMNLSDLFQKIEGHETETDHNGWNGPEGKRLIENAAPKQVDADTWNYEQAARMVKACRVSSSATLPTVDLVWGFSRELDGAITVYACVENELRQEEGVQLPTEDVFLYKKRAKFKDASRLFNLFAFSVGSRNRIYTIRGFGYAVFEAGQGDNILRNKMMDSAMHRASEIYQPEASVDSIEDLQFIDLGHAMIAPKGLKGIPQMNTMRMDENILAVLESNQMVMDKHGSGLSGNSLVNNPSARRNELQVTAELEHTNRMQGFAISLFYGPWDKYIRELVRRSFLESQDDLSVNLMVGRMKQACMSRGVPQDVLGRIDIEATQATRLMGAGSKGNRLIAFQQMGELYASMDPQGQEFFNFDYASEIKGSDAARRYFGLPGQRRGHLDVAIARLENNDLLDGQMVDPADGENKMVHLGEHIEELIAGIEEVNQGGKDIAEWTMQNIPLYKHCVDTLETTTVHESRIQELNSYRQQIQQAGEIIDNGLRHINKLREDQGDMSQGLAPDSSQPAQDGSTPPSPEEQKANAAQQDNDLKMAKIFAEAQAKISVLQQMSAAKMAIMHQESTARILTMDAQAAADIKRKTILAQATAR